MRRVAKRVAGIDDYTHRGVALPLQSCLSIPVVESIFCVLFVS